MNLFVVSFQFKLIAEGLKPCAVNWYSLLKRLIIFNTLNRGGSENGRKKKIKGEWSVAERTTFMEYLCNERS